MLRADVSDFGRNDTIRAATKEGVPGYPVFSRGIFPGTGGHDNLVDGPAPGELPSRSRPRDIGAPAGQPRSMEEGGGEPPRRGAARRIGQRQDPLGCLRHQFFGPVRFGYDSCRPAPLYSGKIQSPDALRSDCDWSAADRDSAAAQAEDAAENKAGARGSGRTSGPAQDRQALYAPAGFSHTAETQAGRSQDAGIETAGL